MPEIDKDDLKIAIKEAARDWLNEKFAEFGKWSLRAIGAASLYALLYFVLTMQGWKKLGG